MSKLRQYSRFRRFLMSRVQHWQYGQTRWKHVFAFTWLTGHTFIESVKEAWKKR